MGLEGLRDRDLESSLSNIMGHVDYDLASASFRNVVVSRCDVSFHSLRYAKRALNVFYEYACSSMY